MKHFPFGFNPLLTVTFALKIRATVPENTQAYGGLSL